VEYPKLGWRELRSRHDAKKPRVSDEGWRPGKPKEAAAFAYDEGWSIN
jgi:hypothetical protein